MGTDREMTAERSAWDGAFNLRDLGELPLMGGRRDGLGAGVPVGHLNERIVERRAALSGWLSTFDVSEYLIGAGLAEAEILRLRQLLRPRAGR